MPSSDVEQGHYISANDIAFAPLYICRYVDINFLHNKRSNNFDNSLCQPCWSYWFFMSNQMAWKMTLCTRPRTVVFCDKLKSVVKEPIEVWRVHRSPKGPEGSKDAQRVLRVQLSPQGSRGFLSMLKWSWRVLKRSGGFLMVPKGS